MTKLLFTTLMMFILVGSLSAQYSGMTATWYPYPNGQPSDFVFVTNGHSQGFYNQFVPFGGNAEWLQSEAVCTGHTAYNFWFAFSLAAQCPEGSYISEDASNGYYPDVQPPTNNVRMIHNGVGIDAADNFSQNEIFEEFWTCADYYNGPSINYDDYPSPCVG